MTRKTTTWLVWRMDAGILHEAPTLADAVAWCKDQSGPRVYHRDRFEPGGYAYRFGPAEYNAYDQAGYFIDREDTEAAADLRQQAAAEKEKD